MSLFGGCTNCLRSLLVDAHGFKTPGPSYWEDSTAFIRSHQYSDRYSSPGTPPTPSPSQHFYTRFCQKFCVRGGVAGG